MALSSPRTSSARKSSGVLATAAKRSFTKNLLGEFVCFRERERKRLRPFLPRNMTRVLAFHEKHGDKRRGSAAGVTSGTRSSSRNAARFGGPSTAQIESSPPIDSSVTSATNGIPIVDDNSNSPQKHDTSAPSDKAMSKSTLLNSKKDDTFDTGHRRSRRRQLEKQHEDENAHLIIDLCNMRKKLNFKENKPKESDSRPRKRQKRTAIRCHCHLSIWDNSLGLEQADPIIHKSEACEVFPSEDNVSPEVGKYVEVKLAQPFVIKSKDMKVWKDVKGETQRIFASQYFMEIKILPSHSDVEWPPIPLLGKSEGDQTTKLGDVAADRLQGSLLARYQHLPEAPDAETPLSIFYLHEGRTYRTKYGMEVTSSWTKADIESLNIKEESDNEQLDDWAYDDQNRPFGREMAPEKMRTPEKKPKHEKSPIKLTYYMDPSKASGAPRDFRKCFLLGLRCPSCPGSKFTRLEALQFHLMNSHHKYKFTLDEQLFDMVTGDLTSATFKVESIELVRPRNIERPQNQNKLWEWHAPAEPFDIHRYVDGDQSWLGVQNKKKQIVQVPLLPAKADHLSDLRHASGGFLRAGDVPDFRASRRIHHPVIRLKTTDRLKTIPYTSVSHRQVRDDEDALSETDDEMDNEWFVEKYMENLDITTNTEKCTPEQRLIRKKWDRHLFKEKLPHSRFLSDSLVRFVKAEKELLSNANPEMLAAFVMILDEMKDKKVINTSVLEDVWVLSNDPNPRHRELSKPITTPRDDHRQPFTCGRCRQMIQDQGRKAVHCSDYQCETPNQWYHSHCADCKLSDKYSWKCPACKSRKGKQRA